MRRIAIACVCALIFATASCSPPQRESEDVDVPGASEQEAPVLEAEADPPPTPSSRGSRSKAREEAPAAGYQYIDETGRVRIASSLDQVPERQRSTAMALGGRSRSARGADEAPESAVQRADVTIYTSPGCGWCRRAIAYFDQKGVDYTNRDITADAEAYAEYEQITAGDSGVPVIVVGEDWMQGWNQGRFDEMLAASN